MKPRICYRTGSQTVRPVHQETERVVGQRKRSTRPAGVSLYPKMKKEIREDFYKLKRSVV